MVVPPADFAPRCAAAITSPRPPVTTVQPRSASSRPTSSAAPSHSAPLPITATCTRHRGKHDPWSDARHAAGRSSSAEASPGSYVARLLEAARRDDRLARELHALHAAPPRGGVGDARAASRRRAAARDVPARRARPRPRHGHDRERKTVDGRVARGRARDRLRAARRRARRDDPHASRCPGSSSTASASRISPTRSRSATACSCSSSARRSIPTTRPSSASSSSAPATRASRRSPSSTTWRTRRCARIPSLRDVPQRWVLVDAAPKILPEIPRRARRVRRASARASAGSRSTSGRRSSRTTARRPSSPTARAIPARTLVWTAGVRANPLLARARAPARRAGPRRRRRDAPRRGRGRRLGARRLRRRQELQDAGRRRSADLPARAAPGAPAREEPHGRPAAVRLPHARPGRDARPLQGDRGDPRPPPVGLPRLVRDADVPPVPAPAAHAEAPRRRRLDDGALLPPRRRRALDARPPARSSATRRSDLQRRLERLLARRARLRTGRRAVRRGRARRPS